jgi:hypothetical protein
MFFNNFDYSSEIPGPVWLPDASLPVTALQTLQPHIA